MGWRPFYYALAAGVFLAAAWPIRAEDKDAEIAEMRRTMREMQKTISQLQGRVTTLEREKSNNKSPAPASGARSSGSVYAPPAAAGGGGAIPSQTSSIKDRDTFLDLQSSAPRVNNEPLAGTLKGFMAIPGTDTIVKLGGNVRLDTILDGKDNGNPNKFIPSSFPDDRPHGSYRSQVTASSSRLSLEVRRPVPDGTLRIYYENDFSGDSSATGNTYRLRQLYGQAWNFLVGQTYSAFMDVDAFPDVVDAQGPNGLINRRLPQIRYTIPFTRGLSLAIGVEQPATDMDLSSDRYGSNAHSYSRIPDIASHLRWEEKSDETHVQLGGILRNLAYESDSGRKKAIGWGVSLSGAVDVFKDDHFSGQATYGQGIERYIQDTSGLGQDAALDERDGLRPLEVFGLAVGYTHAWNQQWKSTVTYGYVHSQAQPILGPEAFTGSQYVSFNILWQPTSSFRMGLEYLYGIKDTVDAGSPNGQRLDFVIRYDLVR